MARFEVFLPFRFSSSWVIRISNLTPIAYTVGTMQSDRIAAKRSPENWAELFEAVIQASNLSSCQQGLRDVWVQNTWF